MIHFLTDRLVQWPSLPTDKITDYKLMVTDTHNHWLTHWLAEKLTHWLTRSLIDWIADFPAERLADKMTHILTNWLKVSLTHWLTHFLNYWPTCRLLPWFNVWLIDWLTDWLNDSIITHPQTHSLAVWLSELWTDVRCCRHTAGCTHSVWCCLSREHHLELQSELLLHFFCHINRKRTSFVYHFSSPHVTHTLIKTHQWRNFYKDPWEPGGRWRTWRSDPGIL